MSEPIEEQPRGPKVTFTRHENFESWYANNIQFQASEWDLKMIFGEMESRDEGIVVQQHTAIVQSWLQAKIMHYFLTMQLGVYEMTHGKIPVPPTVMPAEPIPPYGDLKDDPGAQAAYEFIKKLYTKFVTNRQA